jgi:hypothetical protein
MNWGKNKMKVKQFLNNKMGNTAAFKEKKLKKLQVGLITAGERLRLRDNVHKYMQTREWIFRRMEKDDKLLMVHESGGFGWSVKMDDVDWEEYRRSKQNKGVETKDKCK